MQLTLDNLKAAGAFTGAPVQREISWKQGDTELNATVFVRPLSYRSAVADIKAVNGNTEAVAGRIAACICDEKGGPVFTVADITGEADPERGPLDANLTMALLVVIAEVNSLGKPSS